MNFSCKATGVPKPTISWKFNDGDLPSGVNQTRLGEESFLELSKTTKQMEGIYKCTAQNKANTTASSAYLRVFGKDIIAIERQCTSISYMQVKRTGSGTG